ncbi:MAG: hypothetical protein ACRDFQ_07015 [Anaerolineales bacterium]
MSPPQLEKRISRQARVKTLRNGWRFHLEQRAGEQYQLAQLDDYARLPRRQFGHRPPVTFQVSARTSQEVSPGTWGFGFWNDPGPMVKFKPFFLRLPVLPNAAWFFFAAPPNQLSFDDAQVGNGNFAGVYASPQIPSVFFLLLAPFIPLLLSKTISRWMRKLASKIVPHDLRHVQVDPTVWRRYKIVWRENQVVFEVDDKQVFQTRLTPKPPLALVLWLDNQFGAWRPDGSLGYGNIPIPADCWVEIRDLCISKD